MPKENDPDDVELAAFCELKKIATALERIATVLDNCTYEEAEGFQSLRVTVDSVGGAVLSEVGK